MVGLRTSSPLRDYDPLNCEQGSTAREEFGHPIRSRHQGGAGSGRCAAKGRLHRGGRARLPRRGRLLARPLGRPGGGAAAAAGTARAAHPRRVARALDVGCGSGVQALLASRHARAVVATDVNPRALAFTEFNAALNGITNIETRRGSLFEPVSGERFGLITCNPPYVVSPEHRWTYRDSGFHGDEISERVARESAVHLADGGFAVMTASWVARDEDSA